MPEWKTNKRSLRRWLACWPMIAAGMWVFWFFVPLQGGGICGPGPNNPFGMDWTLQTAIWLTSGPIFFCGVGGLFGNAVKGTMVGGALAATLFILARIVLYALAHLPHP